METGRTPVMRAKIFLSRYTREERLGGKEPVEALGAICSLRIVKLKLAGRKLDDSAKGCPIAQGQRAIGGGEHAEHGSGIIRERELERTVRQRLRIGKSGDCRSGHGDVHDAGGAL